MTDAVTYHLDGAVAVLTIDNPPVNALGQAVRQGVWDGIERAEADEQARAVLIRAAGRTFPVGADVREFGKPPKAPILTALLDRVEACAKPVVAAVHGTALGGGFELALAAHYRIAADHAQVGLPEINLGVLPGAGGTQRVPRLAGAEAGLDLMLSGKPIGADRAAALGLIDRVVPAGDLDREALDWAQGLAGEGARPRPTRDRHDGLSDHPGFMRAVAARREALKSAPLMAPERIVDLVEAVLTVPIDVALQMERAAFQDCLATDEAKAMRHAFFADRRAAKVPELAEGRVRRVQQIGIVGGGLMGAGIAVSCLDAGLPVTLVERDDTALDAARHRVTAIYDRAVAKRRIDTATQAERLSHLTLTTAIPALSTVDLAIEAVAEDQQVKADIFAALDQVLKPGAIIATNTSYLDIDALAAGISRPEDVIGLHFFSPAHVMRLLEIVVGARTDPDIVATGFALAKRLGKIGVRAGVTDGFIGNRILSAYRLAADFMLMDGASPYQIDTAMRLYGFPLGPYQVLDMAGLDISWARRKRLAPFRDPSHRYVAIGDKLCEMGRLGQKSQAGYYAYPEGPRDGRPDQEVQNLIAAERRAAGRTPRSFSPEEIQARCVLAMANEGARLLEEGVALRPSDIDVVMLHGYAFPRHKGGPMMAADLIGLLHVENDLKSWAPEAPEFWTPAAIFDELVKNGQHFSDLNND